MLQVSRTLAQQQQLQHAYRSPLKLNLSDGRSLVPPALVPEWGFDSGRHSVWMNDIYCSRPAVRGKLVCCSHQPLTTSAHCRSRHRVLTCLFNTVKKGDLDTLIVSALSGLFSVSHLLRADLSLALLGPTDPSLAGHLDQCQTANWNVTLPSFRCSSLQDQPHQQAATGGRCLRGYSHTISHSDLTHPSALSVIPVVPVAKGPDSLEERRTQAKQTERRSDQLREHTPAAERVGDFRAVTPAVVRSSHAFLLPHLSTQEKITFTARKGTIYRCRHKITSCPFPKGSIRWRNPHDKVHF